MNEWNKNTLKYSRPISSSENKNIVDNQKYVRIRLNHGHYYSDKVYVTFLWYSFPIIFDNFPTT